MRIIDILVVAGCLGVGYWIVSSIMGAGVDSKRGDAGEPADPASGTPAKPQDPPYPLTPAPPQLPRPAAAMPPPSRPSAAGTQAWHVVLDIPRDASARDIEAARRRRMAAAEAMGDQFEMERIRRAAEEALKQR